MRNIVTLSAYIFIAVLVASSVFVKQDSATSPIFPSPTPIEKSFPKTHIIPFKKQCYQTFNNCGPASLSMALSYVGINISQEELGNHIRPFQNPYGDNDDKSVTLEELAEEAHKYDLVAYFRPNGDIQKLKEFIAEDIPVIARAWMDTEDYIGHYRLVRGYDDMTQEIVQDDSMQGMDIRFSYDKFLNLWQGLNYEYLVIAPKEKEKTILEILGDEKNEKVSYKKALERNLKDLEKTPDDIFLQFNASMNYFYLQEYEKSIQIFETVENKLPYRMLWYQIEPILAYQKLGRYDRVFELSDKILTNQNRAYSELYLIRGEIYLLQGNKNAAREEFEKAVFYNKNLGAAQDALDSLY